MTETPCEHNGESGQFIRALGRLHGFKIMQFILYHRAVGIFKGISGHLRGIDFPHNCKGLPV